MKTLKFTLLAFYILITISGNSQILISPTQEDMDAIRYSDYNIIGRKTKTPLVSEKTTGYWVADNGISKWKLTLEAKNTDAIIVYFDELMLPNGSEIEAYNTNNPSERTRIFTKNHNKNVKTFALPILQSNKVTVEARIPSDSENEFSAVISEIGCIISKGTRGTTGFGDADPCYINVNCHDGLPYHDAKRAVARFTYTVGGEIGNCTGTLLNNTAGDCRNLFLTAQHCAIEGTAAELGQAMFYFNYEAPGCENPSSSAGLLDDVVVGCTRIAASGGQHPMPPDGSDFHLFELNKIPTSYNVYYAGWNRNDIGNQIPLPGAIIQHPLSDIKKISFINSFEPSFTSPFADFEANCIQMSGTGGIIEPNASGSGVFDNNKRVIGTISYGNTGCVVPGGINNANGGKFFFHWDKNGTEDEYRLKPWLDPLNTGVMVLDGKNQCTTSLSDNIENAKFLSIYPNPTNGVFSISDATSSKIHILNSTGILVKHIENLQENTIDISALRDGIYFVLIEKPGYPLLSQKILKISETK